RWSSATPRSCSRACGRSTPRRDRTRPISPWVRILRLGFEPPRQIERPPFGGELRLDRTSEVAEPLCEPCAQRPCRHAPSRVARPPRPAVLPVFDTREEVL